MATIKEIINEDLKQAMREKDDLRLSVLRMLVGAARNKEISLRAGEAVSLNDEQMIEVTRSEIKKRLDSIAAYDAGGRADLAEKERNEARLMEKYLPPQMSDEEIEAAVREIVGSLGEIASGDFGKAMGQVMGRLKGKADGGKINEIVKRVLVK